MNTKLFLVLCIIAVIGGIAIGVYSYGRSSPSAPVVSQTTETARPIGVIPTLQVGATVDEKTLPLPVVAPVSAKIVTVSETMIVINGKDGEMTLPKDPSIVTVLRRSGDQTTVSSLSEVAVGMSADVNIIKPGEQVHLILL